MDGTSTVSIAASDVAALDWTSVLELYDSVEWSAYTRDPEALRRAIAGSSLLVVAHDADRLVGLARVISDGASICYLQDVLVAPTHRRRGIGRALVIRALAPYASVRQKVLLTDDEPGQKAFYESLGYAQVGGDAAAESRAFVRFDST